MKKELDLCPMDNFILALFPNSKIYEDGVVCDFNLLKQKTIEIIKQGRDIEIDIHFNMDDLEVYVGKKYKYDFAFVIGYQFIIDEYKKG